MTTNEEIMTDCKSECLCELETVGETVSVAGQVSTLGAIKNTSNQDKSDSAGKATSFTVQGNTWKMTAVSGITADRNQKIVSVTEQGNA